MSKPILFSAPMINALKAGKKHQTRRIKKGDQCPYGQEGDSLWVRETWATDALYNYTKPKNIPNDSPVCYYADYSTINQESTLILGKWRPSIFMPRSFSRMTLLITQVSSEPLHLISDADAIAEGFSSVHEFKSLWIEINGQASWDDNPSVWVIHFQVKEVRA
jgi:hypothetical protein